MENIIMEPVVDVVTCKEPEQDELEAKRSCTVKDMLSYVEVLEILWQLDTRTDRDQFMVEAQAVWMDIFSKQPNRIYLLLEQLQKRQQQSSPTPTEDNEKSPRKTPSPPAREDVQEVTTPTSLPSTSRQTSPAFSFTSPQQFKPISPVAKTGSPGNIQNFNGTISPPSSPTQEVVMEQIRKAYIDQQRSFCAATKTETQLNAQQYDKYIIDFIQACYLDLSNLLQLCTIFPNLRVAVYDAARLWERYESTNYNYASTKKWTWKRSKLTEGTEMVREGIIDVKLKLDALCTRYAINHGDFIHSAGDITQVYSDFSTMDCVQQSLNSLTWLKNILTDVTNRLQKRNQMQKSQELAAKRMRVAETEFRKHCGTSGTPAIRQHTYPAPLY